MKNKKEVISYITENFENTSFGISDVCFRFNISDKTVTSTVKENTGQTFRDFIKNLRTMKAKKLLSTTKLKMSDIAQMCGYGTEGAFYKAFKKDFDISPGTYRKGALSKEEYSA